MNMETQQEVIKGYGSISIRELKKCIRYYEQNLKQEDGVKRLPSYTRIPFEVSLKTNESLVVRDRYQTDLIMNWH
jgi:hypothetical protein